MPTNAGNTFGFVTLLIAIGVVGGTVLLSIPTGAGREAVRQANRDAIRRDARTSVKQKKRFGRVKPKTVRPATASRTAAAVATPPSAAPTDPEEPTNAR